MKQLSLASPPPLWGSVGGDLFSFMGVNGYRNLNASSGWNTRIVLIVSSGSVRGDCFPKLLLVVQFVGFIRPPWSWSGERVSRDMLNTFNRLDKFITFNACIVRSVFLDKVSNLSRLLNSSMFLCSMYASLFN